jgi:hypothetical protein
MSSDFITAVHVEPRGTFDHVHVSVRGQVVGVLITDKGDGERIRNALLGAKYFGVDRPVEGPITREELIEWRALAALWLGVEEIVTINQTGFVGRIVLRLLDALHEARARLVELDGLLGEAQEVLGMSGHALKALKLLYDIQEGGESTLTPPRGNRPLTAGQREQFRSLAESFAAGGDEAGAAPVILALLDEVERLKAAFVPRPVPKASWGLEKDFSALYNAALDASMSAAGTPPWKILEAQLEQLRPAFEEVEEAARRRARQAKEGN